MHTGELRGYADHVDCPVLPLVVVLGPHASTPNRFLGDSRSASESCLSRFFSSRETFFGTATLTFTSMSPWPPRFGAPLPRILNVRPGCVPAGTLSVTGPFSVGTRT